jgi:hypothetical protein
VAVIVSVLAPFGLITPLNVTVVPETLGVAVVTEGAAFGVKDLITPKFVPFAVVAFVL